MRSSVRFLSIVSAVLLQTGVASTLTAQGSNASANNGGPTARSHSSHLIPVPSTVATPRVGPIVLDGKLDDAAWQHAIPVTDFKQFDPDHGEPSSESIDVRFLYDDHSLYVAAKLGDRQGAKGVTTTVVRRDAYFNSDFFEIVIDGFHDHLGRAFFQVNPSGSKSDLLGTGASCCDAGWDPVWEAETTIGDEGWTVEMRIPFSQLRFSRDSVQTWGLEIRRYIKRRNEMAQWAMWGRNEAGGPNRFGHLEGIRIARTTRNLELLPYAMTRSTHIRPAEQDPFNTASEQSLRFGADVKYLLTPNLTLDATINPDFGQVEVDPAVVNLSAFEVFFQERRPFFVSGSGVFSYGGFNCYFCSNVSSLQAFYSRRVGRPPTGGDLARARGRFTDIPENSSILGAAKITGRTSNGYTVGLMNAVTGRAVASVQLADSSVDEQLVEPLANYFVGRLKKDMRRGDLVLGLIGTSVVREQSSEFQPRLASHAELFGTDWRMLWNNRSYSFVGNLAVSNVEGEPGVIYSRQLSSARFYQRPDRGLGNGGFFSSRLDPNATSMRGYGGYARIGKDAGNWLWESAVNLRSPGFETNDYSFLTNTDYIWNNVNIFRNWNQPTRYYRQLNLIAGGQTQRNFDGDIGTSSQAHIYIGGQTPQFWNANTFYIWRPRGLLDDRLLRGGPSVRSVGTGYVQANISTDQRKTWRINVSPSYSWNTAGGWGQNIPVSMSYQPTQQVNVSFGPSLSNSRGKLQYVRAVADTTAVAFNGRRYVLSDVWQRQLGLDTRVNVTFSPTMTLELYAQPFFASGRFAEFKEFDAPREQAFSVYGRDRGTITPVYADNGKLTGYSIDPDGPGNAKPFDVQNPDFNLRSLRGSAVFRWEYRPGSILFFVWTQQRADEELTGSLNFGRDRDLLMAARPQNIFLLKASWWLAR